MAGLRLNGVAFGAAVLVALSAGFDRLEPSLGLTPDLRITNLKLLQLLALGVWLAACLRGRRWPRLPRAVAVSAAAWLASVGASAVLAPTHQEFALAFARDLAISAVWGWAVYDLATTHARQVTLARALAISGMAVAMLGLLEAASWGPVVAWLGGFRYQASFSVGDVPRISSSLAHPNIAAMLLGLCLPLQLAWLSRARATWARWVLGLGLTAGLVALVLTLSRAGILVSGLVLGLMAALATWRAQPRLRQLSLAAGLGLLLSVGVVLLSYPVLRLRLSSESAESWYRADYATPQTVSAQPGQMASVPVRLTNTGVRAWSAQGEHPFALSYHLDGSDGASLNYDGLRTPLPADVPPGGSVELQAQVVAPLSPGTYLLEWDGVQESVTWFTWAGTPPGRTTLNVAGPASSNQQLLPATAPPTFASPVPPPGRLVQWRIALRMARNRPLLGQGPDNFRWVYGDFAGLSVWDTGSHANSLYFEWLADLGLLGLGAFVWLAFGLLRTSLSSLRSVNASWVWRLGLGGALAAWFLHGFFDYFFEPLPTNVAFWLVAALVCASASM